MQYAYGAQAVKCAVCNHVTPTDPSSHPSAAGMARQESTAAQHPPKPPTQTVVVENPATLDEQGNEVTHSSCPVWRVHLPFSGTSIAKTMAAAGV